MPPQSAVASVKRKRPSDGERPDKRQRSSSSEEDDAGSRILLLEKGILESKKNYNDITVLLDLMNEHRSGNPDSMLAAVALCRVFIRMLAQDAFSAKKNASEKDLVVSGWLKNQFALFKASLLTFLQSDELSITSLTLCMRVLKAEGERKHENEDYSFPSALLQDIVKEILQSDDEDLCGSFLEEYVEQFDDIRFHTFKSVKYGSFLSPQEEPCED
jgi:U3 small nucleolar RNA-associated protein 19